LGPLLQKKWKVVYYNTEQKPIASLLQPRKKSGKNSPLYNPEKLSVYNWER